MKKLITEKTLESYVTNRKISIQNVKQDTCPKPAQMKQERKSPERTKHDKVYNRPERVDSRKDVKVTENDFTYSRKTPDRMQDKIRQHSEVIERRESTYSYNERRTSSDYVKTRRSQTPEKSSQKATLDKEKLTRTPSETKSSRTETKETFTQLNKTVPLSTKTSIVDDKPEWVKQRNLRKTSETAPPVGKKITTSKVTSTTKTETVRKIPAKETKPTDLITSSYGVGPTDENGTPLFGLRALRAQNKVTKGKYLSFVFYIF